MTAWTPPVLGTELGALAGKIVAQQARGWVHLG